MKCKGGEEKKGFNYNHYNLLLDFNEFPTETFSAIFMSLYYS
jgi:hypothetical protein